MLRKKLKLYEDVESSNLKTAVNSNSENLELVLTFEMEYWEKLWKVEQNLSKELNTIDFKKDKNIAAIYNPLDYAAEVHKNFMKMYLKKAPKIVFLGMNPGLFGMCQTSASFWKKLNFLMI